jgi:hypothetical protein
MQAGELLCHITQDPDMPPATTVRSWASNPKHAWFGEAFRKAREDQAHAWFEECIGIADETVNAEAAHQVFSAQTRIRARQFASSRILPHEYGDKPHPATHDGAIVRIYLPALETDPRTGLVRKRMCPHDEPNVIEGTARLEDGSDEPGTDQ